MPILGSFHFCLPPAPLAEVAAPLWGWWDRHGKRHLRQVLENWFGLCARGGSPSAWLSPLSSWVALGVPCGVVELGGSGLSLSGSAVLGWIRWVTQLHPKTAFWHVHGGFSRLIDFPHFLACFVQVWPRMWSAKSDAVLLALQAVLYICQGFNLIPFLKKLGDFSSWIELFKFPASYQSSSGWSWVHEWKRAVYMHKREGRVCF